MVNVTAEQKMELKNFKKLLLNSNLDMRNEAKNFVT